MRPALLGRSLPLAALAAAGFLAGCAANSAEVEAEAARLAVEAAARARRPTSVRLNDSVAESASVYLAFTRDVATIRGGFADPEAIQDALRRGAAYDPGQISQGLVAYASILALQSPEFVAGVSQYGGYPDQRQQIVAAIIADPRYASTLPGADAAAGLIMSVLDADIDAIGRAAASVENDAYNIQAWYDPRRSWGIAPVADREDRLENAKILSARPMSPDAMEFARLIAAAHNGRGLGVAGDRRREPPYPPAVTNALAIAALAALGAAGEAARANTDILQDEPVSRACLDMSKLMLFQCLAASRPSYEDIFCLGRHVVRDLASCARGSALPAPRISVSNPVQTRTEPPRIVTAPMDAPVPTPRLPPAPTPSRPGVSVTQSLNTGSPGVSPQTQPDR